MDPIILLQPPRIVFGENTLIALADDMLLQNANSIMILAAIPLLDLLQPLCKKLEQNNKTVFLCPYNYPGEPTFAQVDALLLETEKFNPDCVVGVGGGSVLDVAKLLAAVVHNEQNYRDVVGVNLLKTRTKKLISVPTTAGTGSEVSPNAIILNETSNAKSGIVSPALLPDLAIIDPLMTVGLPPKFTAETGMDALCHCIEAYTNKFAHPCVDIYALKGIELIAKNILKAYNNGSDIEARAAMALGSMYGGLVLGPVNTHGVHCLSYGLGGKFHIAHGLANAILLPAVMRFNVECMPQKHADIAIAMGIAPKDTPLETAIAGIEFIEQLLCDCNIPNTLDALAIKADDLPQLAEIAMNTTRLLKNCPREITKQDAINIYSSILGE